VEGKRREEREEGENKRDEGGNKLSLIEHTHNRLMALCSELVR